MNKKIDKYGNIYVSETFRLGSKTNTRTVCKLGKVSELMEKNNWTRQQVIEWADQEVKRMTLEKKAENGSVSIKLSQKKNIKLEKQNTFHVGYLFLQSLYSSLGLKKIMDDISHNYQFHYSLNDILSCLVFSRILDPASKRKTFLNKNEYPEQWEFSVNDIYRSLNVIAENSDEIQKKLYKNSNKILNRDTSVLYYDCTNFFFEIETEDMASDQDSNDNASQSFGLRSYGQSKEHRPNPIVQMGMFVDRDGIPLKMNIFPGKQNEQISVNKDTFHEICKDYEIGRFVYCADAGLGSRNIKQALDSYAFPCSYIVTQSIKKMPSTHKQWALGEDGDDKWMYKYWNSETGCRETASISFDKIDQSPNNHQVYYREKWVITTDGREERYVVTYSPIYAHYLRKLREEQIKRIMKKLQTQGKRKRQTDPARLIKESHYTVEGEEAKKTKYEINLGKVAEESRYDGFYCVATDLEDDIDDILSVNKQRWQIEACFREMKTDFDARPVYVRREDRIKAHFLICYIALLIFTILKKIIGPEYTGTTILETIRKMKILDLCGQGYTPAFRRTELTDKLMESFDLALSREYISDVKLNQMINKTKKKRKIAHF